MSRAGLAGYHFMKISTKSTLHQTSCTRKDLLGNYTVLDAEIPATSGPVQPENSSAGMETDYAKANATIGETLVLAIKQLKT